MVFLKTDKGSFLELPIPSVHYVGRGNNSDIKPDSKSVSKRHGKITIDTNSITGKAEAWVEDYSSTFGTFVGESPATLEKINEKTRLFFGFYIRFGHAPACFQYLEHKEDSAGDDDIALDVLSLSEAGPSVVTEARSVEREVPRRESRRPAPISTSSPYKLTDEELAVQMQFGHVDDDSPATLHRTKDLIQQFEAQARARSSSPKHSPSKHSKQPTPPSTEKYADVTPSDAAFGDETSSFRDIASQGSFLIKETHPQLKLPAESFSDLLWEESRTAQPTPTVCLPPSKAPQSFRIPSIDDFAYDLDEKPGADEVTFLPAQSASVVSISRSTESPPRPPSTPSYAAGSPVSGQSIRAPQGPTIAAPPAGMISASPPPPNTPTAGSPRLPGSPVGLSEGEQALFNRNLIITRARLAFRQQKAAVLQQADMAFTSYRSVAKQWRKAALSLDTVAGGFCISVVLPFLDHVKVKPKGRHLDKVRIDARRFVDPTDTYATDANTEYLADFKLRGLTSEIHKEDLSYDYDAVTGLLCVFINRLRLKNDQLLVKKSAIPLLLKGEYVPEGSNANSPSAGSRVSPSSPSKKATKLSSIFSWVPGVKADKRAEAEAVQRNARTYQRVLSRKMSMLTDVNGEGSPAGGVSHQDPYEGTGGSVADLKSPSAPELVPTATEVLFI
jgi:pSer/pThr/pTyr-binding forkhead associated (FHA) protein